MGSTGYPPDHGLQVAETQTRKGLEVEVCLVALEDIKQEAKVVG